ncbi:hypothetical protein [Streptomyces sp. NPDC006638]|uniref:hypothetical protein n=1 Tax=Streptomyces sp. NPDC006638 TaxID=3157183 RepID=UPI0033A80F61
MNTTDMTSLSAIAARNNADWCASVARSHGIAGSFGERAWWSPRRTPPYYPDAVTLRPDAAPADFLPSVDRGSPGCSVKDSFAVLDLASDGFSGIVDARWIHRPADRPVPEWPGLPAERVLTAERLREWQAAWAGGEDTPDVFRPVLLDDPTVLVLAFRDGDDLAGGVVLNEGAGVVGVSNLFAADSAAVGAVWSSVVTAAADYHPGLALVGYEQGDDLAPALATGFDALGPLRIWLHVS